MDDEDLLRVSGFVQQQLGVTTSVLKECKERFPDEALEEEIEVDYSNMSDEENQQQIQLIQQQSNEMLESLLETSKTLSKGTETQITLPIYPSSEIVSHFTKNDNNQDTQYKIPVAVFFSNDNLLQVKTFYDKQLANFDKKEIDGGMVVYMENMIENFNFFKHLELYQQSPHVTIYQFSNQQGEQKVSIEIAYNK